MFKIINSSQSKIVDCGESELYQHKIYIGNHNIVTSKRNSYWYIDDTTVYCKSGDDGILASKKMCVEIFGYTPENKSSTFNKGSELPYINGCSTKQLINTVRPGDPTFQLLYIPKGTSEQAHHIHATARIVYVAKGSGQSIVGTSDSNETYDLNEGDVIILGKMVPHHFKTIDDSLMVLPMHIFSSIGSEEFNHPMFNGTHTV
jgi:quercetin dioxygenase-like cupin family protein